MAAPTSMHVSDNEASLTTAPSGSDASGMLISDSTLQLLLPSTSMNSRSPKFWFGMQDSTMVSSMSIVSNVIGSGSGGLPPLPAMPAMLAIPAPPMLGLPALPPI